MGIGIDEWDAHAQAYATHSERICGAYANALLDAIAPTVQGLRLLDVACGAGVVAHAAHKRGARVTATDYSAEMVRLCAATAGEGMVCEVADGSNLPYSAQFDLVTCNMGVIHLPDMAAGLRGFHRALLPGGAAVFSAWTEHEANEGMTIIPKLALQLCGVAKKERKKMASPEEWKAMTEDSGFVDVSVSLSVQLMAFENADSYWHAFVDGTPGGTQAMVRALAEEEQAKLKTALVEHLTERFPAGPVQLAFAALIVRGSKAKE